MRVFAFAALLFAPALAHAASWDTYVRVGSIWITDPAFDAFSDGDSIPQVQLGVGWVADDRLVLEVGYALASASADLFQSLDSSLGLHGFQGSALYRLPIGGASRLLFRGTAGLELATAEIGPTPTFSDVSTLLAVEGTTGYELALPLGGVTHLAFSVEAGYAFRPIDAHFEELTPAGGETEPARVELAPVDMGSIDLSGPVLRFGAALRF